MALLKTNQIDIVGTLLKVGIRKGTDRSGHDYVSVDAVVGTNQGGVTCEYPVTFYSKSVTVDNQENKLYATYCGMEKLLNKKVSISGSIRENRYFSTKRKQLVSVQLIDGRFINTVAENKEDHATFSLGGVMLDELTEKTNKDGKIYRYDLRIGQANYTEDKLSVFTLHVNPDRTDIISGIKNNYKIGNTIELRGSLLFKVETVSVVEEDQAFGAPVVKTFTNRQNNFFIEGGSKVITDDTKYDSMLIKNLAAAYHDRDKEIQANVEARMNNAVETPRVESVTNRQTSLI